MATVYLYKHLSAQLERVPAHYTLPVQRLVNFSVRTRQRKYVLLTFMGLLLTTILLISQIQSQRRLENEDDDAASATKLRGLPQSHDIAEQLERDVLDAPTAFEWRPSIGASSHDRLFYNRKEMWQQTLAKSMIANLDPPSDPPAASCQKTFNTSRLAITVVVDVDHRTVPLLPFTLGGVLRWAPTVHQVLIVQDGSVEDDDMKAVEELVWEHSKVEVLRTDSGISSARNRAVDKASGSVIVFVSAGVFLLRNWLEPLAEHLATEPSSLVVPTYDRVDYWQDKAFYQANVHTVINTLRPDMATHLYPLFDFPDTPPVVDSPAVRGDLLAITKKEFLATGGYDETLRSSGAANAELSMRRWLCHGSIKTVRCSRVAIPSIGSVRMASEQEAAYVASLWTPDAAINVADTPLQAGRQKAQETLRRITPHCSKSGSWYTTRLMPQAGDTSSDGDVMFSGKLKVDTDVCVIPRANGVVFLANCDHNNYGVTAEELRFTYTRYGYLTYGSGMCLTTGGVSDSQLYILNLETCVSGEPRQRWAFSEKRVLKSIKGGCLKQVSNPKNTNEEITLRIPCDYIHDDWGGIKLVRWKFVPVE